MISSHLLSEVAQTVDQVVVISGGRLRFAGRLDELDTPSVAVRSAEIERLRNVPSGHGFDVLPAGVGGLDVRGAPGAGQPPGDLLPQVVGGLVLGGYAVVLAILAAATSIRRDVT